MPNILVASLGESPIVVTAMYQHLREKTQIDNVMVLRPEGEDVRLGYDMIEEALQGKCQLDCLPLPFEDANGESESYQFLQLLAGQLQAYQQHGDTVYLSLAGGRKNMSALMALVVPFFPCVKSLYQVLDIDEVNSGDAGHQFKSVTELFDLSDAKRKEAFSPSLEKILLVKIPYEEQRVSEQLFAQMYTLNEEQLNKLWEEDPIQAEATEFGRLLTRPDSTGRILEVLVTEYVKENFTDLLKHDVLRARQFKSCFNQMRYAEQLSNPLSQHGRVRHDSRIFHYYKRLDTDERVFYHTEPEDIRRYPRADVRQVIISGLVLHYKGKYKPDEATLLNLPLTPVHSVQSLFPSEDILIVPLGTTPMVATQLYALLKNESRTIREVAIIYPVSQKVRNSAELVKDAFASEYPSLSVRDVPIVGMKDILSEEDCQRYQQALETTIDTLRERHPNCEIVLALSGGRKSMAALAMFAAQRKGIRYVYHTLIKDPELSRAIEDETTVNALRPTRVSKQERNDRLFLRAYQAQQDQFVLFRVPVVPSGGES
ncbi:MAG: CRISPR-associated ring nuclease [Ktedonobacteraceae bacterium]